MHLRNKLLKIVEKDEKEAHLLGKQSKQRVKQL